MVLFPDSPAPEETRGQCKQGVCVCVCACESKMETEKEREKKEGGVKVRQPQGM